VLAGLAVLSLLAASWWLSLTLLGRMQGAPATRLDKLIEGWPGQPPGKGVVRALASNDLPALEAAYSELKTRPGTFAEAVVSLALAEATGDIVKAQRGLEAVRLMQDESGETGAQRASGVLNMLESRLRLVLADSGNDPRQRALAQAAMDRNASASARSAD